MIMDVENHKTIWAVPVSGGEPRKVFEFDDPESRIDYPVWSPDGRWLAYEAEVDGKDGIAKKRADGTGEAEMLLAPGKLTFPAPHSWSADGKSLLIQAAGSKGGTDVWLLPVEAVVGQFEISGLAEDLAAIGDENW